MKKIIYTILIFTGISFCSSAHSQLKLSQLQDKVSLRNFDKYNIEKSAGSGGIYTGIILLSIINPMLVIENKKAYFGLTKEVSAGFYPFGRLAFEYSYIFRTFSTSHLRFSYNYDFIIESKSDYLIPMFGPGVGYFTDTHDKGVFIQFSAGVLLPFGFLGEASGLNPYFRVRNTFVGGDNHHNILDFSIGTSFVLFYTIVNH